MKIKRILAYIIDFIIVFFISSIIFSFTITNNYSKKVEVVNEYQELLLSSGSSDVNEELLISSYKLSKEFSIIYIIIIAVTIVHFCIVGYLLNGATLGKKIFHLKVVSKNSKELKIHSYIFREIFITNIIFMLIYTITLIKCPYNIWYNISGITSDVTTFIYIILLSFMIFSDEESSLQDKIFKTKVIYEK